MIKAFLRSLLKPFSFVPALLMMYLIFSFSAQDGTTSGNLSYKVSEIIVETANDAFDLHWSSSEIKQHIKEIHHPVRKLAHMTEYFLLAISVSFPLYVYGVRGIWLPLLAGMICVDLLHWMNITSPSWPAAALPKRMWESTASACLQELL